MRNFEGSNIGVLSKKVKINKIKINLKIQRALQKTSKKKISKLVYFKASSVKDKPIEYEIHNVNNYDDDWKGV